MFQSMVTGVAGLSGTTAVQHVGLGLEPDGDSAIIPLPVTEELAATAMLRTMKAATW